MEKDRKHIIHYLIVLSILIFGIGFALSFSFNRNLQILILLCTSLFYALYGICHHYIEHDLTVKIVIEYVLIALLGVAVMLFVERGT